MRQHWTLDPSVVFLNHGSYGACPRAVLAAQTALRAELERQPVLFLGRRLPGLLEQARHEVADFVGARASEFAFVRNSTSGVNAVLRSRDFAPGDALLVTDHAYGACRAALEFIAHRLRLRLDVVQVPLPVVDPGDVVERIANAVTPQTRLALVDHVTSQTGLVLPIAEIVRALDRLGVDTLVDGAHAAGMVDLAVKEIDAAYYVANLHKWVCAPKGAAFIAVREDRQRDLHPLTISHGYHQVAPASRFFAEFDWTGTDDPTSWLSVPEVIRFVASLFPGGWSEARARNRALALEGRRVLAALLGAEPIAPDAMIGSLAAVKLPDLAVNGMDPLQRALFDRHRVEVPVFPWPASPQRLLRFSAAIYNTRADIDALAAALREELGLR